MASTTSTGLISTATPAATTEPLPITTATAALEQAPVSTAVAAAPVTEARTITDKETVAGQLNSLLSSGSPVMKSAEANANEASAARGLLNTSIGVGAAQKAIIDAATPIATSDANIYAAAGQSAQEANQATNLAGYNANLSSAQAEENFGYTTAANEQNIEGNKELAAQNAAAEASLAQVNNSAAMELKQADIDYKTQELTVSQEKAYSDNLTSITQQYQADYAKILAMTEEQMDSTTKGTALASLTAEYQARAESIASIYNTDITWVQGSTYSSDAAAAAAIDAANAAQAAAASAEPVRPATIPSYYVWNGSGWVDPTAGQGG